MTSTVPKDFFDGYVRPNDKSKYKPNTDVVNGLLARTYLLTGQWDEAAKAALKLPKVTL